MWRRHRQEQGAVAIFLTLVTCFVMIPLAAFAVDIGQQRVARRDMQAVADTVALDMARKLGSGVTPTDADATESAGRNKGVTGETPTVHVYTGYIDPTATFVSDQSLGCSGSHFNTYFTAVPSGKTANAVLVTSTGSVDFSLMSGSGGVCRSAIGSALLQACMMMDSYAAALNTGNSAILGPLNNLLGTSVNTTVLGSSGILTTNLDVLSFLNVLKTQLGVGGTDAVLTSHVTAAQIVAAEVVALNAQGASVAAQALQSQIGLHIPSGTQIVVGDLLDVTQGGTSGLGATVNPLDLASAAVQLANGTSAVTLTASGGNLTGLGLTASIVSHPTRVCLGDGTKSMAQGSVTATANINAPGTLTSAVTGLATSLTGILNSVLNVIGGLLGGDTYDVPVITLGTLSATINLASATGKVDSLVCDGGTPTSMSVEEGSSLAPATVSIPLTVKETRHYGGVAGIGRKTETVTSTLVATLTTTPSADKSVTASLAIPGDYDKGKSGPSGNLSVGNTTLTTTLTTDGSFSNGNALVNTLLSGITSVGTSVQANLLTPLLSAVVNPLLDTVTSAVQAQLGLTLAGSTYTPLRTPNCGTPKITG